MVADLVERPCAHIVAAVTTGIWWSRAELGTISLILMFLDYRLASGRWLYPWALEIFSKWKKQDQCHLWICWSGRMLFPWAFFPNQWQCFSIIWVYEFSHHFPLENLNWRCQGLDLWSSACQASALAPCYGSSSFKKKQTKLCSFSFNRLPIWNLSQREGKSLKLLLNIRCSLRFILRLADTAGECVQYCVLIW